LDALAQINHHAAGLDIGDAEIYAAVPESASDPAVRVFRTFTTDLQALADWLAACQVDTVAMESTGVYWIPIFELLEERGFQVYLVNARQLKNVSGKKTDTPMAWTASGFSNSIRTVCCNHRSDRRRRSAPCAP
jgi:transposase